VGDDRTLVQRAQADDASTPDELIARYLAGSALLREAVVGMSREQLLGRPIAGKMSSQEVVCHVVDADQFLADRLKRTIGTERPLLMGVESVEYLEALHYAARDLELDLRLLEITRGQMAADLERIPAEAWQRTAVHSETGLVTVRQIMLHTVRHLERHAATIAEKRSALGLQLGDVDAQDR
jgi:uncharacterized damage-inducible protein DinB